MLKTLTFLMLMLIVFAPVAQAADFDNDLTTYYEKSNFLETPRYDETVAFCKLLEAESPFVKYTSFGITPQGRELPLLIVDKSESFAPPTDDRIVLLVIACIHPGESDGKDAGLVLIRDLIRDDSLTKQFDDVVLLFIPIFNVDGHERFGPYNRINQNGPLEMGFRVTAQGYNLNRDFLKADSPEMRAWLKLFREWLPDFFIDCHVTDGADYQYTITYGLETHENMPEPIRSWTNDRFLPKLNSTMEQSGFPIVPYVVTRDYLHISNGIIGLLWAPRYSTGYGAVQNRPALLVETHMLKDFRTRVEGTRILLHEIITILSDQRAELKDAAMVADARVSEMIPGSYYYTNYKRAKDTTSFIDFLGVDVTTEPSDISGDEWVIWGDTPVTYRVPYLDTYAPVDSALIPYAYIIPVEWTEETDLLKAHGVDIEYLDCAQTLPVDSYRFDDIEWADKPWESRHRLEFSMTDVSTMRELPDNSAVVLMNQRSNQVIVHLLEPKAPDSFIRWGFFNRIYSRKEYFEDYVMEKMARQMIEETPDLRIEFDSLLQADSAFAASPQQRLEFFYERTQYADSTVGVYPVGKLMSPADIKLK